MDTRKTLNEKTPQELKEEYQECVLRILQAWLKIPPEMLPTAEQEMELSILEEVAYAYVSEMKSRGIYVVMWMVSNG